ncbi:hypothetical protein Efla_005997 [Eimeria flavescens]
MRKANFQRHGEQIFAGFLLASLFKRAPPLRLGSVGCLSSVSLCVLRLLGEALSVTYLKTQEVFIVKLLQNGESAEPKVVDFLFPLQHPSAAKMRSLGVFLLLLLSLSLIPSSALEDYSDASASAAPQLPRQPSKQAAAAWRSPASSPVFAQERNDPAEEDPVLPPLSEEEKPRLSRAARLRRALKNAVLYVPRKVRKAYQAMKGGARRLLHRVRRRFGKKPREVPPVSVPSSWERKAASFKLPAAGAPERRKRRRRASVGTSQQPLDSSDPWSSELPALNFPREREEETADLTEAPEAKAEGENLVLPEEKLQEGRQLAEEGQEGGKQTLMGSSETLAGRPKANRQQLKESLMLNGGAASSSSSRSGSLGEETEKSPGSPAAGGVDEAGELAADLGVLPPVE